MEEETAEKGEGQCSTGQDTGEGSLEDGLPTRTRDAGADDDTNSPQDVDYGRDVPHDCWKGWLGDGPPRAAPFMGKPRPYSDGGGLCSPGRWPPRQRNLPEIGQGALLDEIGKMLRVDFERRTGSTDLLRLILGLAAGKVTENPFDENFLAVVRSGIAEFFGVPLEDRGVAENQPMYLGILGWMLEAFGDPDFAYLLVVGEGVPVGIDGNMPRTPLVYEEKTRWSLEEAEGAEDRDRENYKSAEGFEEEIEKLFREEEALGMMEEVPLEEAKKRYGSDLHIASLGVVEEKEKIRVIHDGSFGVQVNHRIRTRDQLRMPGAGEIRALLAEHREAGKTTFGILGDASKAHRRIKVRPEDWGYQACKLKPDTVWLNKVGTYGIASAGYWWGRLAGAVLVRLPYYLIGRRWDPEFLLFADDWFAQAHSKHELEDLGVLILILTSLGVPLKWTKFRGGQTITWIGYEIDLRTYRVGIAESRAKWLVGWLRGCIRDEAVDLADVLGVLGRLAFAMGPSIS